MDMDIKDSLKRLYEKVKTTFNLIPNGNLLFYIIFSIIYMETVLRLSSEGGLFASGIIFSAIFGIFFSILLYLFASIFEERVNFIVSSIILFILGFLFASQIVYYRMLKTFYTAYSVGNSGQVLEFWHEALNGMKNSLLFIILVFIPLAVFIYKKEKFITFKKLEIQYIGKVLLFATFIHLIGLCGIYVGPKDENSPYNLYFNIDYPNFSVSNLGLLTYMRLDIQRGLTNWSPKFDDDIPVILEIVEEPKEPEIPKDANINEHVPEEQPEKVIEYNVMDIDFDQLIANETNEEIIDMHNYFNKVKPTEKNEYTGIYQGYNLILITAEGFSHLAVKEDVTPTLYKMVNEGYNFTNFYTPLWGVSTSDGEYVANTGLIPKSGVWSFKISSKKHMPFAMGNQLRPLGYSTRAYHNHLYTYYDRHLSHPNMGYDYKGVGNGLNIKKTWPESDLEMMEVTIPEYIDDEQFHTYYMTVSGHLLYNFTGNEMAMKNKHLVDDLDYSTNVKAYLATQIELDKAMEHLLNSLEEKGILDKTLIAISADHYPYGLEIHEMEELAGKTIDDNFEIYRNAFILYTGGMTSQTIDRPASSLDIIPTISNLMGIEYDSRLLMGADLFSNSKPLVIFSNRSFITDRGWYNTKTKTYSPNLGFKEDEEYREAISSIINGKFIYSTKILDKDYYSKVFVDR